MTKKINYKICCEEIIRICKLVPGWNLATFLEEEEIDVTSVADLYNSLHSFREQVEIDNHLIQDEKETKKIVDEGLRIRSVLIKQQMYGED